MLPSYIYGSSINKLVTLTVVTNYPQFNTFVGLRPKPVPKQSSTTNTSPIKNRNVMSIWAKTVTLFKSWKFVMSTSIIQYTYIIEESCMDGNRALPLLLQQLQCKILWNSNRSTWILLLGSPIKTYTSKKLIKTTEDQKRHQEWKERPTKKTSSIEQSGPLAQCELEEKKSFRKIKSPKSLPVYSMLLSNPFYAL